MTALLVYLLALPVAILFTVGVLFAFLATRQAQLEPVLEMNGLSETVFSCCD